MWWLPGPGGTRMWYQGGTRTRWYQDVVPGGTRDVGPGSYQAVCSHRFLLLFLYSFTPETPSCWAGVTSLAGLLNSAGLMQKQK